MALRLLLLVLLITAPSFVGAQATKLDTNYYAVGVQSATFQMVVSPKVRGRQAQTNWCWAAVGQMALDYLGYSVTQEDLVRTLFGTDVNRPATGDEIIYALSNWYRQSGHGSLVTYAEYIREPADLYHELAADRPVIVGFDSHAYLLTAMFYSYDAAGERLPHKLVLRDPWPGRPSRQELGWHEFVANDLTMIRVNVRRQPDGRN